MNPYELTVIVRPDLDDEQIRGVAEQVTRRILGSGGEMIALYPWSPPRRRLAYPIRDFGDGFYFTATYRLAPDQVREVENTFKLNNNILRFLLVEASELMLRNSQQRAQQSAAAAQQQAPQGAPAPQRPSAAPQPAPSGVTPQAAPQQPPAAESSTTEAVPESSTAETTPVGPAGE